MVVFITGASGYIGGSVANALVKSGHTVRGMTRSESAATSLQAMGVEPVLGELDDKDLLMDEAGQADAVINAANADHEGAVGAIVQGLQGSGKALIHTSGTSIVGDDARGDYCSDCIYSEDSNFVIHPKKQARRDIDLRVMAAANLNIRSCVIAPSLIYGYGTGLNQNSIQIPFLVRNALAEGALQIVGKGLNTWSNVHINDLATLYLLALEKSKPGALYFAESGEASFIDLANALAKRLDMQQIAHLDPELAVQKWGVARALFSFGSNSRVRGVCARRDLGWKPEHDSVQQWVLSEMTTC